MSQNLNDQAKGAILERIPKWLASVAFALFIVLLIISYFTGKRISWSPLGFEGPVQETTEKPTISAIPPGAVVAFADLPVARNGYAQCPNGWDEVTETRGRFILGADPNLNYGIGNDTGYARIGGESIAVLKESHLPAHNHGFVSTLDGGRSLQFASGGGALVPSLLQYEDARRNFTYGSPEPTPIHLIPPYIALTYCKKSPSVKGPNHG